MFESLFQTFDAPAAARPGAARLAALRAQMERLGVEGFLVPRADQHQNEYVPACAERLAWLTGFTGSAGLAVVLQDKAAIFVDGRYTLQVRQQTDVKSFEPLNSADTPAERWIEDNLRNAERLGYDPWLHTPAQAARFEKAAQAAGGALTPLSINPLDAVWVERPAPPRGKAWLHPPRFSGESASAKIARVQKALGRADALVVSDPHAVAWLFNIRGSDLSHTPVALAFALVHAKGRPALYIDAEKLGGAALKTLGKHIAVAPPEQLAPDLEQLGREHKRVRFDAATAPVKLVQALQSAGGASDAGADPIALMKARKNAVELEGSRAAHARDGAAMVNFLSWFDARSARGKLTEIDTVKALESFRRATGKLKDVSFPTISGAGPNGAIVHYRVTEASNRVIAPGMFLLDSGAQYEDGTTDITRTIAVGKSTPEMRDRFTRVIKGHIAVALSVFPKGTSGAQLDSFARKSLWEAGLDFEHGTGHGVGSYLSVHEGPQRIAKTGAAALEPGMILSNEPGYYKAGHWGIRIENLVAVEPRAVKGAERPMLGFETLTLAPIDLRLIDPKRMTAGETAWLNAYHARVRKTLSPLLEAPARRWLAAATRAIPGQALI